MEDSKDNSVDRAKAQIEKWQAQYEDWQTQPTFFHLSPMELVKLAQSAKPLGPERLAALDAAWERTFGEPLCEPVQPKIDVPAEPFAEPEPAEGVGEAVADDDDTIVGWKGAARLAGVSVSTLQRLVLDNRFPEPMRISQRRRGWSRSEISDWRGKLASRRKS